MRFNDSNDLRFNDSNDAVRFRELAAESARGDS
jgi:hypothetical protein